MYFFFFKQKKAYEVRISDWSSDVCSSDLVAEGCGELEEVAYVPVEELAGIEGFDEELAQELQSRAAEGLERREEASRAERRELGVEDDLADIPQIGRAHV